MTTEAPAIDLHQFAPALGVPNASPFCMKLETWLRMADIPYRVVRCMNPGKGPKGKVPFIALDGRLIGDSELIIAHLAETHGIALAPGMSRRDRATAATATRMLSEYFHWTLVYSRWLDDRFWPAVRAEFFAALPPLVRHVLPGVVRKGVAKALHAQGIGRHSRDEIYAMAAECIAAVAELLAERPFFLSGEPTVFDATVYAYLANVLHARPDIPQKAAAREHANLVAYAERMRERYFPEFRPA